MQVRADTQNIVILHFLVSGNTPDEPVVSKLSGHVFEKRLIEKWLEEKNTCPVTNQTLTKEDLIEIKGTKIALLFMLQSIIDKVVLKISYCSCSK